MTIIEWNGEDLPEQLRRLPAGKYVLQPTGEPPELTPEQEEGLRQAMRSVREGRTISAEESRRRLEARLKQ